MGVSGERERDARWSRLLLDSTPDAVYLCEYDGSVVEVNATACARLQYTRQELFRLTPFDFAVGLVPDIVKAVGEVTRTGRWLVSRTHHRRRDGLCYPVECYLRDVVSDGRHFLMAVERALGKPAAQQLPAGAGAAIVLDGGGRVASWSSDAQDVFGMGAEAALGRPFASFVGDDLGDSIRRFARRAQAPRVRVRDRVVSGELRRADGGAFQAEVILTAMHTLDSTLVGLTVRERATHRRVLAPRRPPPRGRLVGSSARMTALRRTIETVAPTDATVLLVGETGSGKELCATAIHELGGRKDGPLITVSCAALAGALIDSELFGHERGAFTGASARRIGRFEAAHGGTLFLDEIAELPLELQPRLLRVLEDRRLVRVGGVTPIEVDVRVIAATNRDLRARVLEGRFREDLFFRLNVLSLEVPPLRERLEDLPELVRELAERAAARHGRRLAPLDEETLRPLREHGWPGNVRELANVVERAVVFARDGRLALAPRGS